MLAGNHLRIVLRDVHTEASVGLHAWERHRERPTRLTVNVEMFVPLPPGVPPNGADLVDYDIVRNAIRAWPQRPHTELLETLVAELVTLCFSYPSVAACRVSAMKPDIFNEAGAVGVEAAMFRDPPA